ncbi:hypothetical protein GCM10009601_36380 [Streptomyces thermospinosisporus]|uniref:Uncharacterized protein n=1 Tax=Streptomyces thermospinosisporus TaxID=161482 RepID=A0ABN1Z0S5_9ACTN
MVCGDGAGGAGTAGGPPLRADLACLCQVWLLRGAKGLPPWSGVEATPETAHAYVHALAHA